jgi:hypothetical protein
MASVILQLRRRAQDPDRVKRKCLGSERIGSQRIEEIAPALSYKIASGRYAV